MDRARFCKRCGKEYEPHDPRQIFCNPKCQDKYRREHPKNPPCICRYCEKTFIPKGMDRTTYCSRDCYFAHKTEKKEIKRAQPKAPVYAVCPVCKKEYEKKGTIKYCSDECRRKKARTDNFNANSQKKSLKQRLCNECGKVFVPEYGDKRRHYCSDTCSHKQGRRNAKHIRRARGKAVKGSTVYKAKVYERDGWKCQICGKKVNKLLDCNHPMAASLDHIIPLSKGGIHEPSNVRLAHRKCNTSKSDRSGPNGDQLLLFG